MLKQSREEFISLVEKLHNLVTVKGISNVKIRKVDYVILRMREAAVGVDVQLFDADKVAGSKHLKFAALNAFKAFQEGFNFSKSFSVEVLLYTSAQKQIGEAFNLVGLTPETKNVALLVITEQKAVLNKILNFTLDVLEGTVNDSVVEINSEDKVRNLMKLFKISIRELEANKHSGLSVKEVLTNLIIERIALLVTQQ